MRHEVQQVETCNLVVYVFLKEYKRVFKLLVAARFWNSALTLWRDDVPGIQTLLTQTTSRELIKSGCIKIASCKGLGISLYA